MTKTNNSAELTKLIEALAVSTQALVDIDEPRLVLRAIADQVSKVADLEDCSVVLFEDEEKAVVVASSERPEITDKHIDISKYPELRRVIETRQPLFISDVSVSPLLEEVREILKKKHIRSIAVLPTYAGEEMLGALLLRLGRVGDPLGKLPMEYFQATANVAALALRNVRLKKDVMASKSETHDAMQKVREEQQYRRRYQNLFHHASDGLVIIDRRGRVVDINRKFQQLTGYTAEEAMRLNYLDLVSPEDKKKAKEFFRNYLRNPASQREHFQILTKDKDIKHVLVGVDLLSGDEGQALLSIQDVTEEKYLQHQLQRTKEFFENLINSSVDAILASDMKGNILIFNQGAEKITGYKAQEVVGKVNIIDIYIPGAAKDIMRKMRSTEYGGIGKLETSHYSLVGKDGAEIPINVSAAIIYEDGKEIATVGIFHDLRPRIRVENELRSAQEQLFEVEKQAAIAALSGAAAHELNQPLTSILGYAELLQKRLQSGDEIVNKAVNTIAQETDRMSGIIRKMGQISQYRTRDYIGRTRIVDFEKASLSPSRYENLFLSMSDGLLEFQCDESEMPVKCVFANPAAVRLLGRAGVSDLMERSAAELFDSNRAAEKIMEETQKEASSNPITVTVRRPDGSDVIIEIMANLVETDDHTSAVELLCRDVTERVKVQEELEEAEQRSRTLLEMAGELGIGLMMFALEGPDKRQIIFANERFEEILGCKASEMRTFPLTNLIAPGDREKFEEIYEFAANGDEGVHHMQTEVVRRDGTMIPIELHASTAQYMGLRVLIGFVRDITDWVNTREELSRLKEFNENIVNNAPIGITVVDADGVVISINDRQREIMGLPSRDIVVGLNLFELSNIAGTEVEELLRKGLQGQRVSISRFPHTSITGKSMILKAEGVPLTDEKGKVRGGIIILEDVTEEAELEESLRRERAYHENIVEQSPAPIIALALDASMVLFNKAAEKLSEFSREEVLGKSVFEIFPSEHITPEIFEDIVQRLDSGEAVMAFLMRVSTKRGNVIEILWNFVPIRGGKDDITGFVGIGRDVTEERRLAKETARRRRVLEALHSIARASIAGKRTRHIYNVFRSELSDIMEHDFLSITTLNRDKLEYRVLNSKKIDIPRRGTFPLEGSHSEILIRTKKPRLVKDFQAINPLRPDDELIAAGGIRSGINAPLHHHNRVIGTVNIGSLEPDAFSEEDFHTFCQLADEFAVALENIQLMDQLRKSNENLARKTLHLEILLQVGRMFRVDMHEQEAVEQYARNIEELFPSPHLIVYLTDPQRNVLVPTYKHQLPPKKANRKIPIKGKIKQWLETNKDYIYHRDTKRVKSYEPFLPDARAALIIPLRIGDNRLGVLVAESHHTKPFSSDDINLIVLMTRQMATSINNVRLFEQALFLDRQLAQSAKMATLGQMAAGIAHELNNPLTSISSYAQLLLGNLRKIQVKEKLLNHAQRILEGTERIDRLVGNLMDYSRMDDEEKRPLKVNELIEEALSFSEFELTRGDVKLVKKLSPDLPNILGVGNQLQQALINLLSNASYVLQKRKGGRITIRSLRGRKDTIRVEIKDNGPGIGRNKVKQIFEPFYTTKPRGQGTGLGLSIVQDIVKKHNGTVTVKTAYGKGSTFTIILPTCTPPKKTRNGQKKQR